MDDLPAYKYQLSKCLNDFVNNNSLTRFSMALFPIIDLHHNLPKKKLLEFGVKKISYIKKEKIKAKDYARMISQHYMESFREDNKIKRQARIISTKQSFKKWKEKAKDPFLEPVYAIISQIKVISKHISGFYMHGSLATLDYVKGFSDFDSIIILRRGVVTDHKKLNQVRKNISKARGLLYLIDPLQHHGFTVIAEEELDCFCDIFPLELFAFSIPLLNSDSKINVRFHKMSKEGILADNLEYIEKEMSSKKISAYDFKFLVSKILLLPSLYLQSKGIRSMKKSSFGVASKEFDEAQWEPINIASGLRKSWKPESRITIMITKILSRCRSPFWQVLFTKTIKSKQASKQEQEAILIKTRSLLEDMIKKSKEHLVE